MLCPDQRHGCSGLGQCARAPPEEFRRLGQLPGIPVATRRAFFKGLADLMSFLQTEAAAARFWIVCMHLPALLL
ncbi:MAG: hypothetical protein ABGX04_14395, partial [Myxococcales bacterium]